MENKQLIKQGAEARVYSCQFLGKDTIVKERFSKKYRHPTLDQRINQKRLAQEAKNTVKARQLGVETPTLYHVDVNTGEIFMELVHGCTVKQFLLDHHDKQPLISGATNNINNNNNTDESSKNDAMVMVDLQLAEKIGESIAVLHSGNIIHGDLTTSNMMLRNSDPKLFVMIDFGLSYVSTMVEDKAVDLYVLERAMLSTHPNSERLFEKLLGGYAKKMGKNATQVLAKLEQVQQRGRKRSMVG